MNEAIINGFFTLAGTLSGGLITFLTLRNSKELKKLKNKVDLLSDQIISYWHLEKIYSEQISKYTSKPSRTILNENRDKIKAMGYSRPTMTENQAIKKKLI